MNYSYLFLSRILTKTFFIELINSSKTQSQVPLLYLLFLFSRKGAESTSPIKPNPCFEVFNAEVFQYLYSLVQQADLTHCELSCSILCLSRKTEVRSHLIFPTVSAFGRAIECINTNFKNSILNKTRPYLYNLYISLQHFFFLCHSIFIFFQNQSLDILFIVSFLVICTIQIILNRLLIST